MHVYLYLHTIMHARMHACVYVLARVCRHVCAHACADMRAHIACVNGRMTYANVMAGLLEDLPFSILGTSTNPVDLQSAT